MAFPFVCIATIMIVTEPPGPQHFAQSIRLQIELNRARTPTERFLALCDLLDAARAMAPTGPEAEQRRLRALERRQREREQLRATFSAIIASQQQVASSQQQRDKGQRTTDKPS